MKFAAVQTDKNRNEDASDVIVSFCHIFLSGTHATIDQRLAVIDGLLRSHNPELQTLGVKSLDAMLETLHFSSFYPFEFGARSRDHGYCPNTQAEYSQWFRSALKFAEEIAVSSWPMAEQVKKTIATKFPGLWNRAKLCADLERISRTFAGNFFWRDGWIATLITLRYEAADLSPDSLAQLKTLEKFLRPKDLVGKVRGIVLRANGRGLDYEDFDDNETHDRKASKKRIAVKIDQLGQDVAADSEAFSSILPELFGDSYNLWPFGRALAQASDKPRELWEALVGQFATLPTASSQILRGFLAGLENSAPAEADAILDNALENPTLAPLFPYLQSSVTIDEKGVARLHRSLDSGLASIDRYEHLAFGRVSDPISGTAFRDLVLAIARKPGGGGPAVHLLAMRLYSDSSEKRPPLPETVEAGREVLASFELSEPERHDHELGSVAEVCLVGKEGEVVARRFVRELKEASSHYSLSTYDYGDLMEALIKTHPIAVLDELFTGDEESVEVGMHLIESLSRRNNPLDGITSETLIAWCKIDPVVRYKIIAEVGAVLTNVYNQGRLQWTPLAQLLLTSAPDPRSVINQLVRRLRPTSWSGSLATEMERRANVLAELNVDGEVELSKYKAEALGRMKSEIEERRRSETERDKKDNERFE